MEQADPRLRVLQEPRAGIAERAVEDQPGTKLGFGVWPLVRERHRPFHRPARQQRPGLDEDQLARHRDERRDVAHPVPVQAGQRVEVRPGQGAEGNREDVQLAGLDEREEERERPIEGRERDVGRRFGAPPLAEPDRRAGRQGHQDASSAAWNSAPYLGSRGAAWWRTRSTAKAGSPARATRSAEASAWSRRRSRARPQPGTSRAIVWTHGPNASPSDHAILGSTPVPPFAQSWSRPAARTSRSVTPDRRSTRTTSRPCRRSATCMASNSSSSGGRSQAVSARRSWLLTRATRCDRSWRALCRAHEEVGDTEDQVAQQAPAEEDGREHDDEAVLPEDRADRPRLLRRQEPEQDGGAVERRDGDQVEDREQDVEGDEVVEPVGDEVWHVDAERDHEADDRRPDEGHHEVRDGPREGHDQVPVAPVAEVGRVNGGGFRPA